MSKGLEATAAELQFRPEPGRSGESGCGGERRTPSSSHQFKISATKAATKPAAK